MKRNWIDRHPCLCVSIALAVFLIGFLTTGVLGYALCAFGGGAAAGILWNAYYDH